MKAGSLRFQTSNDSHVLTAIDDFGAGYAGLNMLADVQPNIVKLDMALSRHIDADRGRRAIAKGIETTAEMEVLRDLGVELFHGYYFARPAFRSLAEVAAFPG